jgi:hypothetical protein
LKCAGFFLRKFAYVEASYRKLGYPLSAFAEKTCALEELSPACAGAGSALFCLCGQIRCQMADYRRQNKESVSPKAEKMEFGTNRRIT